jgi:hypothetical protein
VLSLDGILSPTRLAIPWFWCFSIDDLSVRQAERTQRKAQETNATQCQPNDSRRASVVVHALLPLENLSVTLKQSMEAIWVPNCLNN